MGKCARTPLLLARKRRIVGGRRYAAELLMHGTRTAPANRNGTRRAQGRQRPGGFDEHGRYRVDRGSGGRRGLGDYSGTKHLQRTARPPAAPPTTSGAGRFLDMASARREGACNPHNRCVPADRARRHGALLSRLPAWRCTVGYVRLCAPCPGVPGLWKSVRPRMLESRACRAMTCTRSAAPLVVTL